MISIQNLNKTYRTDELETLVINNLDLTVEKGSFISIMGPSGCGKSTLLNIIGLLDSADTGSYIFEEKELIGITDRQKREIRGQNMGFIYQNFNLLDEFNIFENVELPLIYAGIKKNERKERVNEILERLKIVHRSKHYPMQLSGGQQQRVAVARALVNEPSLILADEPTGNLDSKNGNDVMELFSEINQNGTTILMVTHSSYDAGFSNKIMNMKDGKIISESENQVITDIF